VTIVSWVIFSGSALVLALILLHASLHKFKDSSHFQSALRGYGLFPERALIFWWVVPLFELAGASEILVSVGESRFLASVILGLYSTLIFYNLIIGRVSLDCGCGGVGTKLSWWMFGRNVALLLFCIPTSVAGVELAGNQMLFCTLVAFTFGILFFVFYLFFNQVLSNAQVLNGD
jgi:hypothetical protein